MYRDAADALQSLLSGKGGGEESLGSGWRISKLTGPGTVMKNGIEYCFVEVTFSDGTQYGIPAYGDEALALYEEASYLETTSKRMLPVITA